MTDLDSTATRVLLATVAEHRDRGRCTVRSVALRAGVPAMTAHSALHRLRAEGLVDWQEGARGTLRPLVAEVCRLCKGSGTRLVDDGPIRCPACKGAA